MRPPTKRSGFTLIELLTVIAIIAILMALLLPTISITKEHARKADAKHDLTQLVGAVRQFYADYGVYPIDPSKAGQPGNDIEYGNPGEIHPNADLVNVLRADPGNDPLSTGTTPLSINSRAQSYLDVPLVRSATSPRSGLITSASTGSTPNGNSLHVGDWVDPWGNEYIVCVDADYNGYVQPYTLIYNDLQYVTNAPGVKGKCLQSGCIAASYGADGKIGANGNAIYQGSDDVLSWY